MKLDILKRIILYVLVLSLVFSLSVNASAADEGRGSDFSFDADFSKESLSDVIDRYLSEKKIESSKFTMGFYDTLTGETYYYNKDVYMEAGSMFKLPMNMVYSERVYNGELGWDDVVGEYRLGKAMELSIVNSNNAVSYSLLNAFDESYRKQREILGKYSEVELPNIFYEGNNFSPEYVISVLKTLYENENGQYDKIIEYMKIASPGFCFHYYDQPYVVGHKYGSWKGNLNDCGIIYGPHPILLVAFTRYVSSGEEVLAQICRIVCDYSTYLGEKDAEAPEPTPTPTPAETPAPAPAETPVPQQTVPQSGVECSAAAICAVSAVIIAAGVLFFFLRRKKHTEE